MARPVTSCTPPATLIPWSFASSALSTPARATKVTVSIPASLIPLRHFNVDEDTGTGDVTLTFPIRVFYTSSLKEEAVELLANPDDGMTDYIASHTDSEGKVYFLANEYTGGDDR